MEEPLLVPVLRAVAQAEGIPFDPDNATYYIGHETIVATNEGSLSRIPEAIFSYLNRNAVHEEGATACQPNRSSRSGRRSTCDRQHHSLNDPDDRYSDGGIAI